MSGIHEFSDILTFRVVTVNMQYRTVYHLANIGAVKGRTRIVRWCRVTDAVAENMMMYKVPIRMADMKRVRT